MNSNIKKLLTLALLIATICLVYFLCFKEKKCTSYERSEKCPEVTNLKSIKTKSGIEISWSPVQNSKGYQVVLHRKGSDSTFFTSNHTVFIPNAFRLTSFSVSNTCGGCMISDPSDGGEGKCIDPKTEKIVLEIKIDNGSGYPSELPYYDITLIAPAFSVNLPIALASLFHKECASGLNEVSMKFPDNSELRFTKNHYTEEILQSDIDAKMKGLNNPKFLLFIPKCCDEMDETTSSK